jgi:N-methylhydantoinase A/oxoprolinase/acetone carboxylase beta subunit
MRYRVGIDVGGTHTDAVLLEGRSVLAWAKRPTSADVISGVAAALSAVLAESDTSPERVAGVMVGTTHFTNAVLQGRGLTRTAALRLCLPAGQALTPFIDWPDSLREAVGGDYRLLAGGYEFDGRPIAELDEAELAAALRELRAAGVQAIAVTGIFSPRDSSQEARAADLISDVCTGDRSDALT